MPELPEVAALVHYLREHGVGREVTRVDVASLAALKTYDPPVTDLVGRTVTDVARHGKHLDVVADGLHLVIHLARAGWLRWSDSLPQAPPKPGRGPIALRVHLAGPGFDLTEAGTKKGLAVWVVADPSDVESVARLGPDALSLGRDDLAGILGNSTARLKTALTDQSLMAGIGNAYSDEILHLAKLSPYATAGKLDAESLERLADAMRQILADAVERSVGQEAARLKGEKRSGLRVHGRTGLPCPVCGDTVREVSFADKSFQYCPTCQTKGKPLSDRRMDRLLR
ncbi:Fpg/Nei family DNA glycosylase [Haloechinothrix salitolerans]|uniref:Fpg/Nei family DNA glycosylase n=1 Tax=Haloechinothrix salitolerans TaxID=926830 RepID=A0ABW2BRF9_9PSEU